MDKDYRFEVRSRGGIGRGAIWEWSIYDGQKPHPIKSGEVKGAESKASTAARAEIERLEMYSKVTKKPKRPRDPNQLAKLMVDIASGETEEAEESEAAKHGREGGKKRASNMTPERRSDIAKKAAAKRWSEKKDS